MIALLAAWKAQDFQSLNYYMNRFSQHHSLTDGVNALALAVQQRGVTAYIQEGYHF